MIRSVPRNRQPLQLSSFSALIRPWLSLPTARTIMENDDEDILDAAMHAMKQTTLTNHEIEGRQVLANNGGKTLLQQISDIKEDHQRLQTKVNRLESLGNLFIDVREKSFLTYLRDRWRQPHLATQVRSLNRSVVHGGHAEADALMFLERRPADELRQYVYLYGLNPTQIQDLAFRGLRSTLKALSAVGGFHLDGKHLLADEEKIFEEIKLLVNDGKYDEAEEVSKGFPFQKGFIEFDPIIEMG